MLYLKPAKVSCLVPPANTFKFILNDQWTVIAQTSEIKLKDRTDGQEYSVGIQNVPFENIGEHLVWLGGSLFGVVGLGNTDKLHLVDLKTNRKEEIDFGSVVGDNCTFCKVERLWRVDNFYCVAILYLEIENNGYVDNYSHFAILKLDPGNSLVPLSCRNVFTFDAVCRIEASFVAYNDCDKCFQFWQFIDGNLIITKSWEIDAFSNDSGDIFIKPSSDSNKVVIFSCRVLATLDLNTGSHELFDVIVA